jgi:hypothetical protein
VRPIVVTDLLQPAGALYKYTVVAFRFRVVGLGGGQKFVRLERL